jgi:hypothetical protein
MGKSELVDIDLIRIDGGTQARVSINQEAVEDYADNYKSEDNLPPVVVFFDGSEYLLADGFHRYHGARKAELAKLNCEARKGTQRDAILFAVGANRSHGLKRTNADKRKAVGMLLNDPEWAGQSDRWLADTAGVSNRFVGELRAELCTVHSSAEPEKRKGKDGKVRDVKPKSTERRTKPKKEKAAPPPPPAKDALGNELPDHLQKVAANTFLKDSIDALNRLIRAATDFGNSPAGRFLIMQDDKSGKGVIPGLTQARNAMVNAQFHCVCPECGGKPSGCGTCRKSGWLPAWRMAEIEAVS